MGSGAAVSAASSAASELAAAAAGLPWFWGGEGRRQLLAAMLRSLLAAGRPLEVRRYGGMYCLWVVLHICTLSIVVHC